MTEPTALDEVLHKWRARWPEWQVAEAFVPASQRERALAWLALLGELADAAWGGSDPSPGAAKLGWWAEELTGWAHGARRHPLGGVLQKVPAPWAELAAGLPALAASRTQVGDLASAVAGLAPFAEAFSGVTSVLFDAASPVMGASTARVLLGERALRQAPSGTPGEVSARGLLQQPWFAVGSRPERIHAALLRARLQRLNAGRAVVVPAWRALLTAWRAARG